MLVNQILQSISTRPKITRDKIGIRMYIILPNSQNSISCSLHLNDGLTIYKVELYGIFHSLLIVETLDHASCVTIFTDSVSAATSIKINKSKTDNHLINDINDVTQNLPNEIQLVWIPSHRH
jgi:ribonuclease HI